MQTNASQLGKIRTMSQDIEDARRKQQGQLKQSLPISAEPYEKEDILKQLKQPPVSILGMPPSLKPSTPAQTAASRPFMPAPSVSSRPGQTGQPPAPPATKSQVSPTAPIESNEEKPLSTLKLQQIAPQAAPKLGELALRPQATKPPPVETLPPLHPTEPAPTEIKIEKPTTPSAQLPKNFIPVEEEELERMLEGQQAVAITPPVAPKIAKIESATPAPPIKYIMPITPPALPKPVAIQTPPSEPIIPIAQMPAPPPITRVIMPPKVSVAAEKPLNLPLPTTMPIGTPTPMPSSPIRPQTLSAAPPINLPGIEKEIKPLRPTAFPSALAKEGGLKSPEEILGLPLTPTPVAGAPERQMPQPLQMSVPQSPAATPPLPSIEKFAQPEDSSYEETPKRHTNILQFVAILLGVLIIVGGIGGFVYWRVYLHPSTTTAPVVPSVPAASTVPTPFFTVSQQQTIELQKGNESFLVEQLRALEHATQPAKTITYLPVKKLADNSYLQTKDLLSLLNINLPKTLTDSLNPLSMLYLYTPGDEEKSRCTEANNFDVSCYSSRLGIVFKILPGHESAVQNIMSDQEQNLVQLFTPIILGSPLFDQATGWKTANYTGLSISYPSGVIVRYNNMPISATGLNYVVVNGYLTIATSKNASYSALDQLVSILTK